MKKTGKESAKVQLLNYMIGSIAALAGILFITILAIQMILVQPAFLNGTNEKYNIASSLSMTDSELEKATNAMVLYVKGKIQDPQVMVEIDGEVTGFFNEKEITHLSDVREVIRLINGIAIVLAVICIMGVLFLAFKGKTKAIVRGVFLAWLILLIITVAVGIIAVVDVNHVIYGFHKLFFTNDLWLLDPAVDRSIWMFGNEMYIDALIRIAAIIGIAGIFTNGIAIWGNIWLKRKESL